MHTRITLTLAASAVAFLIVMVLWLNSVSSRDVERAAELPSNRFAGVSLDRQNHSARSNEFSSSEPETLTFSEHIAPIIFENCSGCHRPGQSAPFSLLNFEQVRKRSKQILEVVESRFMPPWLPAPEHGEFSNARELTERQIALIREWVEGGAVEGDAADLPPPPEWSGAWQLGEPDAVLAMPEAFALSASGPDVYRNFVIPTSENSDRFVRAAEIRPGNAKVVHHAVMQVDRTRASRSLDESDPEPGFGGIMSLNSARIPDGHFVGWTPGKTAFEGSEDLAWRLEKGCDLVLQLHMRPSGKPETVQAMVGMYFSDQPPSARPYALVIRSKRIDIPPGESAYRVEANYTLPVDVDVLSIYPHAHYLGKELKASAVLPEGVETHLIRIADWDFNWQDEYRYAEPVFLPKGSIVSLDYTYDNSPANIRNPNNPPKRVEYGQNSTDEMAELMLQVLPRIPKDLELLRSDAARRAILDQIDVVNWKIQRDPLDVSLQIEAGSLFQRIRRNDEALVHFRRAVALDADSARAHYLLADLLAEMGRFDESQEHFEESNKLEPSQPATLVALSQVLSRNPNVSARDPDRAIRLALEAAELTGFNDPSILETVAVAHASAGHPSQVIEYSEKAIRAAEAERNQELADQIRGRLDAYRARAASEPEPKKSP